MSKYYYTNMISALATGQISYRDAMCEILKRLCDLENDKVQNQADWTETDSTSPSYIQHKPSVQEFQADWNETNSTAYGYIQNKPTIPPEQVQSDWTETDSTSKAFIKNKPTLPSAQVQSDWNETSTSSVSYIKNKPGNTTAGTTSGTLVPPTIGNTSSVVLHANGSWDGVHSNYIYWQNGIMAGQTNYFTNALRAYGIYPRASWSRYTQCFAYQGTLPAGANNTWGLQCVQEWIPGKFWHFHGWVCLYTADNSGVTTSFFNYGIDMRKVIEHTDLTVSDLYQAYTSGRMYSQSKKYVRYTDSAIDPSDAFAALQYTDQQIGGTIQLTYVANATCPCVGRHCAYVYRGSTMILQDYPLSQQKPGFIEFEIWVNPES